jgi:hypothetical protein
MTYAFLTTPSITSPWSVRGISYFFCFLDIHIREKTKFMINGRLFGSWK